MVFLFGDCELHNYLYELRRQGKRVPLEPQVFDVLSYLVEHHDRFVSKQELFDHVWPEHFVTEAALNNRIMAARKAIGDSGRAQKMIQTVHGRGFRFIAEVVIGAKDAEDSTAPQRQTAQAPASEHPSITPAQASRPQSSLLGRDEQLAQLHAAFSNAERGERQLVFVTGEAGLGKTTLVNAFIEQIDSAVSVLVGRGQCIEHHGAGEAYLPVLDATSDLCRQDQSHETVALLTRIAPTWLLQLPWLVEEAEIEVLQRRTIGATPERMLREIAEALRTMATSRTLVIVLEDLHWSDYSTVDLVSLLARRRDPARLLLLGTYRLQDLKHSKHPLYALQQDLHIRGQSQELALTPLGSAEVQQYLSSRLAGAIYSEQLVPRLLARTEGSPLFMRAVVDSWISQGLVGTGNGDEQLEADIDRLARDIPGTLREMIEQQVSRLSPEDQTLLEAASVVGKEFSTDTLTAALLGDAETIEDRCNVLARQGRFLTQSEAEERTNGTIVARFGFAHDLYHEVLYQRVSAGRRQALHERVGRQIEAAYSDDLHGKAAELAFHFSEGRDRLKAVRYRQLAAEQASHRGAYREAVDHILAGLDSIQRIENVRERTHQELVFRAMLAPALIATRGWSDPMIEDAYDRARDLAQQLGDMQRLSPVLYGLATFHELRGEYHKTQFVLTERSNLQEEEAGSSPLVESAELMACSTFHQGNFEQALQHAQHGLTLYDPTQHLALTASLGENPGVACHHWSALSLWFLGYPEKAQQRIKDALRLAEDASHWFTLAHVHEQTACLHQHLGDARMTQQHAETTISLAEQMGFPYRRATGSILRGWALVAQGHPEGLDLMRDGIETCSGMGARIDFPYFHGLLADACLMVGDHEAGLASVATGLALAAEGRGSFYEAELHRLKGLLLLQKHEASDAGESLRKAIEIAHSQQAKSLELRARASLVRFLSGRETASEEGARLASLYEEFSEGFATNDLRAARTLLDDVQGVTSKRGRVTTRRTSQG